MNEIASEVEEREVDPDTFQEVFAQDVDTVEARVMAAVQKPIAIKNFSEKVTQAAWKSKRSWYLVSASDRMISPELERFMAKRIGATVISLPSSHVSMVSHPTVNEFEYTFDRLAQIVEKFITAINLKKYSLYVMDYGAPLFYSYGTNPPLYPQWQEYFRKYQPPTLIVWGNNDYIFPAEGAYPYQRDLKNIEFHLLDTGHFALEEEGDAIADHIRRFITTHVVKEDIIPVPSRK